MASQLLDKIYAILLRFLLVFEMFANFLTNVGLFNCRNRATLPKSLDGKVAVITGANSGIGKVTATTFAKLGATVVMACRDSEKSKKSFIDISNQLPTSKKKNLTMVALNLSSLESVRSCAEKINSSVPKIDYLINNAGIMMCPELKSKDGYELQFATNHLGHFLLTNLLLDKVKAAPSARIVNLSSAAHLQGEIHFDNINLTGQYKTIVSYGQSKLANALFTRELAKRLKGTNVTTYALHPGVINTNLARHIKSSINQILNYIFDFVVMLFFINEDLGAQTTLYCAFEESLKQESGHYYSNCGRVKYMTPKAVDDKAAAKLWDLSLELCNKKKTN